MSDQKYNGWNNYETWNCALWLSNDEYTEEQMIEIVERNTTDGEVDVYSVEQEIESFVQEGMPELPNSMYSDMMGAAISSIDFREIAEHYAEDYKPEPETE